jgi:hypothetical protein
VDTLPSVSAPPTARPFPTFIADSPQEGAPYGRWGERLAEEFARACAPHVGEAGAAVDPSDIRWFPERGWGGRVHVPASARVETADGSPVEYFGHVSFVRPDEGEPTEVQATADFTDVTADENPDWKIDLNDDVIGRWRAEAERGGDVTLIWGLPLVRGAVAATAEVDGVLIDQAPVQEGRFTLVAVDALHGFGDQLFIEVRLWDRELRELAAESLYAEEEPGEETGEDEAEAADAE